MWTYLLLAVVVLYLLAPTRLPWMAVSAQGALLTLIFIAHLVARRGRIDAALLLPLACFFAPMAIAAVMSPTGYEPEYIRPLLLGGIASYLFAFYFRTYDSLRPFRIALFLLVFAAAYMVAIASAPHSLAWLPSSHLWDGGRFRTRSSSASFSSSASSGSCISICGGGRFFSSDRCS